MKPKLKVFEEFSQGVLPHEANYLSKIANFQDFEKNDIFETLLHNAINYDNPKVFNPDYDKRKYYYIKTWIEKKLSQIDVDNIGNWLLDLNRKLRLDLISAEDERQLLTYISNYKKIGFNFTILYELIVEYRAYLMVRLRYEDHQIAKAFLDAYESAYKKSKEIEEKLYQATIEITNRYTSKKFDFNYWEKWLMKVFETPTINGSNRYKAFVLLTFHYNTTGDLDKFQQVFDKIDQFFSDGQMYCRRLLYNYYSTRVLLHTKKNELEKAIYFGKISIRQNNEDTLLYVNNLVSNYLRCNDYKSAELLLKDYHSTFEKSHNYHQKITYFSYHLRVQNHLGQIKRAENQGYYFLNKYEAEILKYRWHHFFTSYVSVLLKAENYNAIINLEKKYQLMNMEGNRQKSSHYISNISWCVMLAMYMENKINKNTLIDYISQSVQGVDVANTDLYGIKATYDNIVKVLPEINNIFKSY